jgi:arylsulfatase A
MIRSLAFWIARAGAVMLLACGLSFAAGDDARPPNIVLILADDLGYGDLGCYGSRDIRTPNLDRMSSEGVRLTQFYVTGSLCSPSRAGLLTGREQIRTGVPAVLGPDAQTGLGTSEITIAAALKQRGYRTACIGKWHLGSLPKYLPGRFGFDSYFGLPYSNDMGKRTPGNKGVPLMRDSEIIEQPVVLETLTQRYTAEALKVIRESKDRPFFLYMPHTFPHVPLAASEQFRGKSPRGLYGDVVEEIDWSVGEIVRALAELGLDKNTLVLFASDNGPWLAKGKDAGSAGFLRDGKATAYEGGVRIPFLARWPGRLPAGQVINQPAWTADLFPTLVHLAGGTVPSDRKYDGQDIMDVLTGKMSGIDREFIYFKGKSAQAIRSGKWKLHLQRAKDDKVTSTALYDLEADPVERDDRAALNPEIVEKLSKRALAFEAEVLAENTRRRAAENAALTTGH